jgi:hypothetical protein
MQIAFVSKGGAVLDAARKLFSEKGIDLIHLKSISDLFHELPETQISGVVVDIRTVIRASEPEKSWLKNMEQIIPNIRINWRPAEGFSVLSDAPGFSGAEGLSLFLDHCRTVKPRVPRKYKHREKNLNLLLWPVGAPEEEAQRAFTLNISAGGLFVCTCDVPPAGTLLWVRLLEVDSRPVRVLVKWGLAWREGMHIPGFGGKYVDPDAEFLRRLAPFLRE